MNVKQYIDSKGFQYKIVKSANGNQLNLKVCPFCHKEDYHFYISENTGQFFCHHGACGAAGGFFTLKKHLGDIAETASFSEVLGQQPEETSPFSQDKVNEIEKCHNQLLNDKETLLYLSARKFTRQAISRFKLGVTIEAGEKWLLIPYFSAEGTLQNVKCRSLPPAKKKFRRWEGGLSCLFNEIALTTTPPDMPIIITEGETDCIALWSKGFENTIGVPLGANGIKPEWIKRLDKFSTIIFAYDNDQAGMAGAQKFANRLGIERCKRIRLPIDIKDVNEFFIKGRTANDFKHLIESAEPFEVENVLSIASVIRQTINDTLSRSHDTKIILPWNNVNRLLGGLHPGDLIVIGGKPGVGKSSFACNILYSQAIQNVPCLLFSLEMPLWRLVPRFVALHKGIDSKLCSDVAVLTEAYNDLKNTPLYFAYKYDRPNWQFVSDTIRASVKYHGIQLVVFDNLHFLCRSLSHQTEEVSVMTQNFKLLAEELAIPIIVIARPRKTHARIISGEDLKDSADIEGDADIILIVHRERKKSVSGEEVEGNFEPLTMVVADKVRYSAGGTTFLWANDAEMRFSETLDTKTN